MGRVEVWWPGVQLFHLGTVERMAIRRLDLLIPVRDLSAAGLSVRAIATALRVSPTTVLKILHLWNAPDQDGMITATKITGLDGKVRLSRQVDTSARDSQIRELRAAGRSLRSIAAEVECSIGTVHRVLKR